MQEMAFQGLPVQVSPVQVSSAFGARPPPPLPQAKAKLYAYDHFRSLFEYLYFLVTWSHLPWQKSQKQQQARNGMPFKDTEFQFMSDRAQEPRPKRGVGEAHLGHVHRMSVPVENDTKSVTKKTELLARCRVDTECGTLSS